MENNVTVQLQQAALEIFKEFIKVCEELDVKYYLIGGTLLGAVRHKGFIPWDDDIDVGMPRKDYEKFIANAQKLLPEHLFVQTHKTDPGYHQVFAKIRNSNTTFLEQSISHREMNHGVFIDIFPLDDHDENKMTPFVRLKEKIIKVRISCVFSTDQLSIKLRLVRHLTKLFYPTLGKALDAREKIYTAPATADFWANYSGLWGEREIIPASWYGEGQELEFEGLKVRGPVDYDKWLTQVYGDYMQLPPVEKRVTHHGTKVIDVENPYTKYMGK